MLNSTSNLISKRYEIFSINSVWLRRFLDLQFDSIMHCFELLVPSKNFKSILDIGSGQSPYKNYFNNFDKFESVDSDASMNATYRSLNQIQHQKYDLILLIETLEHIADPQTLLENIHALMKPNSELWISVPFAARYHPCPEDYYRWTSNGLKYLLEKNNFRIQKLLIRGNSLHTLVSKFNFLVFKYRPISLIFLPVNILFIVLLKIFCRIITSKETDPLGYFICAQIKRD